MNLDYYRNKHLLGELTFGDLMDIFVIEGEYTLGSNWLPITKIRRSKSGRFAGLFMYSMNIEPDLVIPIESRVKLRRDILEVMSDLLDSRNHRIWIRLERLPSIF